MAGARQDAERGAGDAVSANGGGGEPGASAWASREHLEVVLREVADGITVQDPSGRLLFANDAAARQIGFESADDLLAAPLAEVLSRFELFDEARRPFPVERLPGRRALAGERPEPLTLCYRVRATGEERWSTVRATPVREDGRIVFAINVLHDVTEQKRVEHGVRFLAGVGEALAESLDYDRTLARVAELAVPAIADWCVVYMQEPDGSIRRLAVRHFGGRHVGVLERLASVEFDPHADVGVPAVLRTGRTQLHPDASAALLAADVLEPDALAEELEPLGIASWMCVPLTARGRTFGAISFLAAESGRRFGGDDVGLAEELARRAAFAVDNARLYREAQFAAQRATESFALLDTLLSSAPVGFAFYDRELRYVRVNPALAEMNGFPPDEHIGRRAEDLIPDLDPWVFEALRRVLETGEPVVDAEVTGETPAAPGIERTWLVSYYRVSGEEGEPLGVGAVVVEVTERKHMEAQLRASQERMAFLAEASTLLASTLDYETTLASLARLAVPRLADWCSIDIRSDDGGIDRLAVAHADPAKVAWARELQKRFPPDPAAPHGVARVLRTGEPDVLSEIPDELLAELARSDPELLDVLRELGLRSTMCVPLTARGRTLGAITFVSAESGRRFDSDDLGLAVELARRAAIAVDNARLFREAQELAQERARLLDAEHAARRSAEEAAERLRRLQTVTEAGLAHLRLDELLDALLDRVRDLLGTDTATVLLLDPAAGLVYPRASRGFEEEIERGATIPVGAGFAGRIAATGEAIVVEEVDERTVYNPLVRERGLTSMLGVPLRVERRITGVLHVGSVPRRRFSDDDRDLLQLVADRVALAIENARLYEEAERRARAAQALTFIADGVFLVDESGRIRVWNRAAAAVSGLPEAEVAGRPAAEVFSGWESLAERIPVVAAERAPTVRPETVPVELAGRELWLSISGVEFPEGTVYAFRDLTEERTLEQIKSDFVSTVSHELRTPLAAIYGAALTLQRTDTSLTPDQHAMLLRVVGDESERLARIVNDILWASRLESGHLHVAIESCDAGELARSVVETARLHAPPQIELDADVPDGLPRLAADPDKTRQVLVNLVDNAVKYSPDGGRVDIALESDGRLLTFRVRDAGLGIPPSEQERVFEKFYRLDPNLTRGVGGTGLGLYICRELVRRMNGRIWVESRTPAGSEFVVELPTTQG